MSKPSSVPEIRKEIPVSESTDVIVAGGGPAGIGAAVSAARLGVKVTLLEQHAFMGGVCCAAMASAWDNWDREGAGEMEGLYKELVERLKAVNGIVGSRDARRQRFYDVESLKYVLDRLMSEVGVKVLFHTFVADAIVEGNQVKGVAVQNKSGRHAILGHVVVDATGDADVAYSAGAPCMKGREPDHLMQPASLMMKVGNVNLDRMEGYLKENPKELLPTLAHLKHTYTYEGAIDNMPQLNFGRLQHFLGRSYMGFPAAVAKAKSDGLSLFTTYVMFHSTPIEDEVMVNMSRVRVDATDGESLSLAEMEGRRQSQVIMEFLKKYVPGFEQSHLIQTAPHIGLRESRRVIGEHILHEEECKKGIVFPDTIATAHATCLDVFDPTGKGFTEYRVLEYPVHIPYRSLMPKGIDGLLAAGRCLSATHIGVSSVRSQHKVMAAGQAAGVASALSVKGKVQPRGVKVELIQSELKRLGVKFGSAS